MHPYSQMTVAVYRPQSSTTHIVIAWIVAILTSLYMLPWAIAATRSKQNIRPIVAINVFLGWTLIGWVAALVMACVNDPQPTFVAAVTTGPYGYPPAAAYPYPPQYQQYPSPQHPQYPQVPGQSHYPQLGYAQPPAPPPYQQQPAPYQQQPPPYRLPPPYQQQPPPYQQQPHPPATQPYPTAPVAMPSAAHPDDGQPTMQLPQQL